MMDVGTALICLLALQAKHFLADFCFQTNYMLGGKARYGHPGGVLHALSHGGLTALVLAVTAPVGAAVFLIAGAEALVHYHVDWMKEQLGHSVADGPQDRAYWMLLGADQLLHQITLIGIVWIVFA